MLKQRILTALILAPTVIAGIFLLADVYFAVFIACFILTAAWEFADLCEYSGPARFVYAMIVCVFMGGAYFVNPLISLLAGALWWLVAIVLIVQFPEGAANWNKRWQLSVMGVLVLVPAWIGLVHLKSYDDGNFLIVLLMALIWAADIGAYFVGRAFGRKKLAPSLSPGKSWAGVWGGVALAAAVFTTAMWLRNDQMEGPRWFLFFALCMMVVLMSVIGDLTESMLKRNRGIKDSSNLLPGHGGFLDRIDSLVAASPVFALSLLILGW